MDEWFIFVYLPWCLALTHFVGMILSKVGSTFICGLAFQHPFDIGPRMPFCRASDFGIAGSFAEQLGIARPRWSYKDGCGVAWIREGGN